MRLVRHTIGATLALLTLAGFAAAQTDSPYIRVVEQDKQTLRLDVAVRTLVPKDEHAPLVNLVGAIHIADHTFYDDVQALMDIHDVVLYEGVGGGREAIPEPTEGDPAAALLTERRIRFLSVLVDEYHSAHGAYPDSGDTLLTSVTGAMETLVSATLLDGWGAPLQIHDAPRFDIVSLGADGQPGGRGDDADISASDLASKPRVIATAEEVKGLQRDLADALGLTFQLDGIDYSHPRWRNSDLSIGEIQHALGGADIPAGAHADEDNGPLPADAPENLKAADMLFRTLSGDSFLAKFSGFLLKFVGSSPTGRVMTKVVLADMLTQAEDLLAAQPGPLADLMKVIVEDRNAAVVRDLKAVIDNEPDVRTLAIFYGAGHFGDLEKRIENELGYDYQSTTWIPAITINLKEAGLSVQSVKGVRAMMHSALKAQLESMRKD